MALFDLKLPFLGERSPRAVVGMDIGTDAVRLALVERAGAGERVRWVEEISLTALQGFADYDSIVVIRQGKDAGKYPVRYSDLVAMEDEEEGKKKPEAYLMPGDTIVVP